MCQLHSMHFRTNGSTWNLNLKGKWKTIDVWFIGYIEALRVPPEEQTLEPTKVIHLMWGPLGLVALLY